MSDLALIVAYGTMDIEEAVAQGERRASAGKGAVVVGISRHPKLNCWQVGLSRQGDAFQWVSAHRRKNAAEQQILQVARAAETRDLTDEVVFASLAHELAIRSDYEMWMACVEAGRRVLEQVVEQVVREHRVPPQPSKIDEDGAGQGSEGNRA